jgi:putative ABC transport system permease protein
LFAIISYHMERKQKEIGIRKIVGASAKELLGFYATKYLKLISIGSLLGVVFAIYGVEKWLETFAFRIEPGWILVTIPLLSILVICSIIVFANILSMIKRKAVDALRYE